MPPRHTPDSFWARVPEGDGCRPWPGSLDSSGYGQLKYQGRMVLAHRLAWELTYGEVPPGMHVLHNCPDGDNPRCCNPLHLKLGTHAENMADMAAKGRSLAGERSPQAKLNAEQVRAILAQRGANQRVLAQTFGVDKSTISRIFSGQQWTTVEAAS